MTIAQRIAVRTAVAAGLLVGCTVFVQAQGVGERVGEALDNAGRAVKGGIQNAGAKVRVRVAQMEVLDRVTTRIQWDKGLAGSAIDVTEQPGGITVLRGVAPDARAKAKAVELARETVGVTQVVDQISIGKVPAATAPAPVVEDPKPLPVPVNPPR